MDLNSVKYLSGVELENGNLIMAAQNSTADIESYPHTLLRVRSVYGDWSEAGYVEWATSDVSYNIGNNGIILLSAEGDVLDFSLSGHQRTKITDGDSEDIVNFRFIRNIDGVTYAGGVNNSLFQFAGSNWSKVHDGDIIDAPDLKSHEGLVGFNASELYAFGWGGALYSNVGGLWEKIETPTNVILTDGDVLGDTVFIAGQVGTIIKGRADKWEVVENDLLKQDIWSVRAFENAVYFSCLSGILRLKKDELTLVKGLGSGMRTAMSLFVGPSGLWSVGASDIVLFDGEDWHTIAQSD